MFKVFLSLARSDYAYVLFQHVAHGIVNRSLDYPLGIKYMSYIPGSGFKTETLMISKAYRYYFCDYTYPKTFDFSGAEQHGTFRFSPGESWCSEEA